MVCSRGQHNVDRSLVDLKKAAPCEDNVAAQVCHIGREDDRKRLIEQTLRKFGGINSLVSTVGVHIHNANILTCPKKTWDKIFEGNFF